MTEKTGYKRIERESDKMILFILILGMLLLKGAKIADSNEFCKDYMSIASNNVIKGVFVLLVLLGHAVTYVQMDGVLDQTYLAMKEHLHQMVVSVFFLYSGYGMMKSIQKKGYDYVKGIPAKRFLIVFLNFDIAVCLYLVVNAMLGTTFDLPTILYSLIGWKSVGNSNWYMFAIFGLYILMFLSFLLMRFWNKKAAIYAGTFVFTVLTMLFVWWEIHMGLPRWYYDTMILMPVGCIFALFQKPIEKIIMKNDFIYAFAGVLLFVLYWLSYERRWLGGIEYYTVWELFFVAAVVFITMKISFQSKILSWFGEHVFSVYILQRIPMILLSRFGLAAQNRYGFIIGVLVCTVFLALIFDAAVGKFDKQVLKLLRIK